MFWWHYYSFESLILNGSYFLKLFDSLFVDENHVCTILGTHNIFIFTFIIIKFYSVTSLNPKVYQMTQIFWRKSTKWHKDTAKYQQITQIFIHFQMLWAKQSTKQCVVVIVICLMTAWVLRYVFVNTMKFISFTEKMYHLRVYSILWS